MLFCHSPRKRPESSEGLESPLALHRVEGQKVVKGQGRKTRFQRKMFQIVGLPNMGRLCLDCGSCQNMVTSCQ